jgi:hypothetical protein
MTNQRTRWGAVASALVDGLADVVDALTPTPRSDHDPTESRDARADVDDLTRQTIETLRAGNRRQAEMLDRAQTELRDLNEAIGRARSVIMKIQTDKANLAAELDWYRRRYGRREAIEENQRLLDDATAQAVQHLPVDAPGLSGGSCRAVGHGTADHSHEPDVVTDEDVTLDILAVLPAHWPRELRSLVFDADVKVLDWRDQLTDALLSLVDDYVGYAQRYLLPYLVRRVDAAGLRSDVTRAQHDQLLRATGAGTTANPVAEPCD